ncbi:MAG: hypothetical protein LKH78_06150 [Weizmannia coagulans]|nr:hypothetical protein [Heyndrickxia coagulans]
MLTGIFRLCNGPAFLLQFIGKRRGCVREMWRKWLQEKWFGLRRVTGRGGGSNGKHENVGPGRSRIDACFECRHEKGLAEGKKGARGRMRRFFHLLPAGFRFPSLHAFFRTLFYTGASVLLKAFNSGMIMARYETDLTRGGRLWESF